VYAQQIIDAGRWIDQQGWCPATGGNFSIRLDSETALVTASGCHKGHLSEQDMLEVDLSGQPKADVSDRKPSAETLLHTRLYSLSPQIGAVLHTHSVASTVLSRLETQDWFELSGYEMQKSLVGNTTHDEIIRLAVFDNTQDMSDLAGQVSERWMDEPLNWGFLVSGHGLYAWGKDMQEARRHLEGLEFLFACALEMRRMGAR